MPPPPPFLPTCLPLAHLQELREFLGTLALLSCPHSRIHSGPWRVLGSSAVPCKLGGGSRQRAAPTSQEGARRGACPLTPPPLRAWKPRPDGARCKHSSSDPAGRQVQGSRGRGKDTRPQQISVKKNSCGRPAAAPSCSLHDPVPGGFLRPRECPLTPASYLRSLPSST